MPVSGGPRLKRKKKSDGGFLSGLGHVLASTGRGLYHTGTGLPTGAYMLGKAGLHDVQGLSSGAMLRDALLHRHSPHSELAPIIGQSAKQTYLDLRHPGRHGADISPFLLSLLGVTSMGGGAFARLGQVSRAGKTGESLFGALMRKPTYVRRIKGSNITAPASRQPILRGGKSLFDALAPKRVGVARAGRESTMRRERFQKQLIASRAPKTPAIKDERAPRNLAMGAAKAPMQALRGGMMIRPRYALQNAIQTLLMQGDRPLATLRSARTAGQIKKTRPQLYKDLAALGGEPQTGSIAIGASGPGQRAISKIAHYANIPEQKARRLALLTALRDAGFGGVTGAERAVGHVASGPGIAAMQHGGLAGHEAALNAIARAEEEVGTFGRLGKNERAVMRSQIPIFYPMFKALSRYGARFPAEHSIQSAMAQQLGTQGKAEQKRILGDLPFWASYLIPTHAGDKNYSPKGKRPEAVLNPTNIYNLQPGLDIGKEIAESVARGGVPRPGISLLQQAGPFPQIVYSAATGKDLATGYPIQTGFKRNLAPLWAALVDYGTGLPGSEIARSIQSGTTKTKSYQPDSVLRALMLDVLGPAFVARQLRTQETQKQAKRESSFGQHKGKHHGH